MKDNQRQPATLVSLAWIHEVYALLCSNNNTTKGHPMITIPQELAGILAAAQAEAAENANPTQSVLTPADLSTLDQIATTLGAPVSTSTSPAPAAAATVPASS